MVEIGTEYCVAEVGHRPCKEMQDVAFKRAEEYYGVVLSDKTKYSTKQTDQGVAYVYTKTVVALNGS